MVRPRLVEEGEPIRAFVEDHMDHAVTEETAARRTEPFNRPSINSTSATAGRGCWSSLQQAAGPASRYTRDRPRAHESRVVIGGEEDELGMDLDHSPTPAGNQAHDNHHYHIDNTVLSHHISIPYHNNTQLPHPPHHNNSQFHSQSTYSSAPSYSQPSHVTTHFEIGADTRVLERMTGIEDSRADLPLVVVDGANVAYAYGQTLGRSEPHVRGLSVVVQYFHDVRLRIVLPAPWMRRKPTDGSSGNALMQTEQLETLESLQAYIVASPPRDDDDAYALTIARREERQGRRGYVLSNDWFRDAQSRDSSLRPWLDEGRISYTFVDTGVMDETGEPQLDLLPNPRHSLIEWIEKESHR